MKTEEQENKSNAECIKLITKFFINNQQLLNIIAPNGWRNSEYVNFMHPTPKQQFEQHQRISTNLRRLTKIPITEEDKLLTVSDFKQDDLNNINELEEFIYVLGHTVYDIFSNNHEVKGKDNKIYDLGSMRGSGSFIAGFINMNYPAENSYDYMDFYMGSEIFSERVDLYRFYEYIFKILQKNNCDWTYYFPRLGIVSFNHEEESAINPSEYSPEEAVLKQMENVQKKAEVKKMKEELDKIYDEEFEKAKYEPLTSIVRAYKAVYGVLPVGHPQKEFE